jgi:glycosyltransferase involved in cell wall biosynthesis
MTTVSVIIPAFNMERHVLRAVESVLAQDYPSIELIVVDDGSTDGTAAVLAPMTGKLHLIRQENRGLSCARNRGILAATGELVAFLDADDFWLPGKLSAQVALFERDASVGFVSCDVALESEAGDRVGEWRFEGGRETLLRDVFTRNAAVPGSGSAVVVRRELFAVVGLFDRSLTSLEDIDMWMRLAGITKFDCVPEPLAVIMRRDGSMSSDYAGMKENACRVMKKNRKLLAAADRGGFWRMAYSAMLTDYAKWAYREGHVAVAVILLLQAAAYSTRHWRLIASLLVAMTARKDL